MATTSRALEEYNGKAIHFLSAQYTQITYINLFLTILHARMGKPLLNTKTNVDLEYFTIENTMDPAKQNAILVAKTYYLERKVYDFIEQTGVIKWECL